MADFATQYAPAERVEQTRVLEVSHYFKGGSPLAILLNLVPEIILILNRQRQVVFANRAALEFAGVEEMASVLGMRPGELFHCKHANESDGGCGTSSHCRCCGAVNALLASQEGQDATEECRLTIERDGIDESLDLRVWARPLPIHDESLTFVAIANIGDEKRREFLERIFLHDLMNTATALRGFSWLLHADAEEPEMRRTCEGRIALLTERMVNEIQAHRELLAAENGELKPSVQCVNSYFLLQDTFAAFGHNEMLERRLLRCMEDSCSVDFVTDPILLGRVLGNMVKNAIEASAPGETVTMGCREEEGHVVFWVHNPAYMPEKVRLQVFQRSFSTKERGRGLGTYSIKYLTEKYLGGDVSFTSTEAEGTTFQARYPLQWRGGRAN